jgi:hypothetical protein
VRILRTPILNSLLFHSYLRVNIKVLLKIHWAIIGEGTIVPHIMSTVYAEQKFYSKLSNDFLSFFLCGLSNAL